MVSTALVVEARTKCQDCYATYAIYQDRIRTYKLRIKLQAFLGLAGPVAVGSAAAAYGLESKLTGFLVVLGALLLVPLTLISLWALIAGWESELRNAVQGSYDNFRFYQRFKLLLTQQELSDASFRKELNAIDEAAMHSIKQDVEAIVKDSEKCYGHRAALKELQLSCATCGEVPRDIKPTNCGTCGKFLKWRF